MYNPRPHQIHDDEVIRQYVAESGIGLLITSHQGHMEATLLPLEWVGNTVRAHVAKVNPQVEQLRTAPRGLWVVQNHQAYISPSWYASKQEDGRVVPTWNYSMVQLRGTVRIYEDSEWLRNAVTTLTEKQESHRVQPWTVQDAPQSYIQQQLRGIVGVEMTVESVEAKAKWSQNRHDADTNGVMDGLRENGELAAAEHMQSVLRGPGPHQ